MAEDVFELAGRLLDDRYQVERVVGEGGFAVVYRGLHVVFKKPVAIKCLKIPSHFTRDARQKFMEKFREEATLLDDLGNRHPHIVSVKDFGFIHLPAGQVPYLVLEWLDGHSLADVLASWKLQQRPPLTEAQALDLLMPVVEALAVAHSARVAHRDIKPENLFLLDPPPAQILDFGIAKVMQEGDSITQQQSGTSSNFHSFSPRYGAPEQFSPKKFGQTGPWTDIHALGLVLIELLTGQRALQGDDYSELLLAAISPERPAAPASPGLSMICARMVALDPRQRYQSASELMTDLLPLAGAPRSSLSLPSDAGPLLAPLSPRIDALARTESAVIEATLPAPPRDPDPAPPAPRPRWPLVALAGCLGLAALLGRSLVAPAPSPLAPASAPPSTAAPASSPAAPPARAPGRGGLMLPVAGGVFTMGAADGDKGERPPHEEQVAPFWMDETEVTVEAFSACVRAGACQAEKDVSWDRISEEDRSLWSLACNWGKKDREQHPINCVDWYQATAFCAWAGKRLPTEVEWEFAARGGPKKLRHPWGDRAPDASLANGCGAECVAWFAAQKKPREPLHDQDDGWPTTAPVGRFPALGTPAAFGLKDMVGNVWEWTASPPGDDYSGPRAALPRLDCKNVAHIQCQATAKRSNRGSGWSDTRAAGLRGSQRGSDVASDRTSTLGFRCAWAPAEP